MRELERARELEFRVRVNERDNERVSERDNETYRVRELEKAREIE